MIKIGKYSVSSNNYSKRQVASVYVRCEGMILCKMQFDDAVCDPLRQIQQHPKGEYREEFIRQLRYNDVPESDIKALLVVQPSRYMRQKKAKSV